MKFLVDECLSPKLTELAHERGYGESSHVVWLGRSGAKDWDLIPLIVTVRRDRYPFQRHGIRSSTLVIL